MRQTLQRFGYHLANVNPLSPCGLLTHPDTVRRCIPPTMSTLLDVMTNIRSQGSASGGKSREFLSALQARMGNVSIDENEAIALEGLVASYCGDIGYELEHCATEAERQFFAAVIEHPDLALHQTAGLRQFDDIWIMGQLARTQLFGQLLGERYATAKTFGIEGMETATLALNTIIETFVATNEGQDCRVELGTLHRGRLNYIANCLKVDWADLLAAWDPTNGPTYETICEPASRALEYPTGSTCQVTLLPMPCHLEAMAPALTGKARAHAAELGRRAEGGEVGASSLATHLVLPVNLHGDSSFCGQGIIQESLQISMCKHYECGGTIHMILNNQVGFTTELPIIKSERFHSSQSSDLMKSTNAPILHVNANSPRSVVRACQIAVLYRKTFGADIMIDLVGWRKRGHNEMDDPTMTNAKMYKILKGIDYVTPSFQKELEASLSETEMKNLAHVLEEASHTYKEAKALKRNALDHPRFEPNMGERKRIPSLQRTGRVTSTGISRDLLKKASAPLVNVPNGFNFHPLVGKVVNTRKALLESGTGMLDWATAELLCLSSLATKGIPVRLSGEDTERGAFATRHAVWHDAETGEEHPAMPALMEVTNSPLSELGVVGYEFGWSLGNPRSLVLWEAEFGDFSNEAQVIFDTILSGSKSKWNVESGLVLVLPHGYDGMGPEHSSCRPERFLQLFAASKVDKRYAGDPTAMIEASNFVVACPSTPANYFHLLRRQLTWPFRRPLVVMTPKRTLRMSAAMSPLSDILVHEGQDNFSCVLDDPYWKEKDKTEVKGLILCCGQLFYDLSKIRDRDEGLASVSVVRLEQLAPFPGHELGQIIQTYPNLQGAVWAQEEPANAGALSFVREQVLYNRVVPGIKKPVMQCISRPASATPAEGHPQKHAESQKQLLDEIVFWGEYTAQM